MYFNKLSVSNFKNFPELHVNLNPGFHFITGHNGSGKTNFLDAFYYSCMSRSFHNGSDKLLVEHGKEFFRLESELVSENGTHQLVMKCKPPLIKEIYWDDKKYDRNSSHIGRIPVVIIAPDEVYFLMKEQEERRKFLNNTIMQMDRLYFEHYYAFIKILKQRNAALKQMKVNGAIDSVLLDALDYSLVLHSDYIYIKRKELVEKLNPLIIKYVDKISGNKQSALFRYFSDADENYAGKLKAIREKDYYTMRTNIGVHRDRVECLMGDYNLSDLGSQGQLKSFIIAMKLAQFQFLKSETGRGPVVLLDDIFAKLDSKRVEKLLQLLVEEDIKQCFISDTHIDRTKKLMKHVGEISYLYQVQNNQIQLL